MSLDPAHLIFLRAVTLANCRTRDEVHVNADRPESLAHKLCSAVKGARRWNAITAPIRRMAEDTGIPAHKLLYTLDNV